MKKQFDSICLAVLAAFVLIICGVFIGRNFLNHDFSLSTAEETSNQTNDVLTAGKVDINLADAELLQLIPGVGKTLAEQIVAYREEHGPFSSVVDVMLVPGVGEKTFRELYEYITVN